MNIIQAGTSYKIMYVYVTVHYNIGCGNQKRPQINALYHVYIYFFLLQKFPFIVQVIFIYYGSGGEFLKTFSNHTQT